MVRWLVGLILHGGPIDLLLVLASAPRLDHGMCSPVCGVVHIKDPSLPIERVAHVVAAAGFLSRYLNDPLPYV